MKSKRQLSVLAMTVAVVLLFSVASPAAAALIITGVVDGPLAGGTPKAVELYADSAIADLGLYAVGSANNGGGTDGPELTLSGAAAAGDFLYVASEEPNFTAFFGMAPNFTGGAALINGDDAVELFFDASGSFAGAETVVDIFGDINVDGSGEPWDHLDGWAYRNDGTGPDGSTFELGNWSFSGVDALDGETTNAAAANPFPKGSYLVPEPGTLLLALLAGLGLFLIGRRRRSQ